MFLNNGMRWKCKIKIIIKLLGLTCKYILKLESFIVFVAASVKVVIMHQFYVVMTVYVYYLLLM